MGFTHSFCLARNENRCIVRTTRSVARRALPAWQFAENQGAIVRDGSMSISNADMAGTDTLALSPEIGRIARWRDHAAVFIMLTGGILNVLALIAIMPAITAIAAHFAAHASPDGTVITLLGFKIDVEKSTQMMITLLNIGILFAGPLLGLVAGRVGYMRVLPFALIIYAVSGSAGLYLDDPAGLLLSRLIIGLAAASISICCYSLIGDRFQGVKRSRMLGYQAALVMAFGLIGLEGGGWIADLGWRVPFAIYLVGVPMALIALVAAQPPAKQRDETIPVQSLWSRFVAFVKALLPMWPLYVMLIPFNLAAYMTSVHIFFVLASDGIVKGSLQGHILASSFVFNIVTALLYGRITAGLSRKWIFVGLIAIFATSDMIIGLSHNWVGSMIGIWVAGLGGGLMTPFFVNTILNRAPDAARGAAIGLMYTMMYLGDFANPFVITPLRQHVGNHQVFGYVGVVLFAVVLLQALLRWTPLGPDVKQTA
jgi:MFS family permease